MNLIYTGVDIINNPLYPLESRKYLIYFSFLTF